MATSAFVAHVSQSLANADHIQGSLARFCSHAEVKAHRHALWAQSCSMSPEDFAQFTCAFEQYAVDALPSGRVRLGSAMYDPMVPTDDVRSPVHIPTYCLAVLAAHLAEMSEVILVELETPVRLQNKAATWILQSGSTDYKPFSDSKTPLQGEGEVITIIDTGLDTSSCYFSDVTRSTVQNPITQPNNKVVQYISYSQSYVAPQYRADFENDGHGGHGTHVAGSAAGHDERGQATLSGYDGMAKQAKLAIYDFGYSDAKLAPIPVVDDLFSSAYDKAGARVFSNSWGASGSYDYTTKCSDVDEWAYEHKDALVIFAAGNDGDEIAYPTGGSIVAPGSAKNVLTVGKSCKLQLVT